MGIITSIRRNVKDGGRCSVFVNEAFFAACPIDVATSLGLRKGLEMSDELERNLRKEDRRIVLRQKTYHYATYKPRTEKQVRMYLAGRKAVDEEIDDVMKWLIDFHLLDDRKYAERFLEAARDQKPLSRSAAKRTLKLKGVPEMLIDDVLEEHYLVEHALDAARRVAQKKIRMLTASTDKERNDKLMRFLQYRGYAWDVIRTVLDELRSGSLALAITSCIILASSALSMSAQAVTTCKRDRLPDAINRFQTTTQPVISPNGTLFVDRKQHPNNADGGVKDPDDVWMSRHDVSWKWIEVVREQFTTFTRPDVVFSFTSDGLAALVVGRYRIFNGDSVPSLAIISRRSKRDLFTHVETVVLPGVDELGRNFYGVMSDDRQSIIVALERPGGVGGLDLYHTSYCQESWSALVNLGSSVNTVAFEGAPWLAPDGVTLYFASSGRDDRRGKADLYMTRRRDDSWQQWSTPVNLGSCINTIEDETAFSLIGRGDSALIYSWDPDSDRPGIYLVELPEDIRPLPTCRFAGQVVDAVTNAPLTLATLIIQDTAATCIPFVLPLDSSDNTFAITLPSRHQCKIVTRASHYVDHHHVIGEGTLDSNTTIRVTTRLFDTRKPLASIYFDRGVAQLNSENAALLQNLVQQYDVRQIDFEVVGYTDVVGTPPRNNTLSQQRARSVFEKLLLLGLLPDRIRPIGRGIENPGTLLGLKENPQSRRVDIFPTNELPR